MSETETEDEISNATDGMNPTDATKTTESSEVTGGMGTIKVTDANEASSVTDVMNTDTDVTEGSRWNNTIKVTDASEASKVTEVMNTDTDVPEGSGGNEPDVTETTGASKNPTAKRRKRQAGNNSTVGDTETTHSSTDTTAGTLMGDDKTMKTVTDGSNTNEKSDKTMEVSSLGTSGATSSQETVFNITDIKLLAYVVQYPDGKNGELLMGLSFPEQQIRKLKTH